MGQKRKPRIYPLIEYPGLTIDEQITLMKQLDIYSPEVENILRWHPKDCPVCGKRYFPSGSSEVRCWSCQHKYRTDYWRRWKQRKRKTYKGDSD